MGADAASFIQFALRMYARPGVAPLLLEMQNAEGRNVNCVLLAAWGARLGRRIDGALWTQLQAETAGLREAAVLPIRAVRKSISKDGRVPDELKAPLKRMLLYAEVRAEQAEEHELHRLMVRRAGEAARGLELLRENLTEYCGWTGRAARFAELAAESGLLEEV